jgi:site-specific recombinase XerD
MPFNPFDVSSFNFSTTDLTDAPIKVLIELYLTECEAKNLQPLTVEFYRTRLVFLEEAYGHMTVDSISTAHLRALLAHLKDTRQWNPQNINHAVTTWKQFFNYLEKEEITDRNPARKLEKVRQEKKFPKPFTLDEITRLFDVIPDHFAGHRDRTCCVLLLDAGIRLGELTSLTIDSFDLPHGVARVYGKGRKERFVPFSATTRRFLVKYLAARSPIIKAKNPQESAVWITEAGTPMREDTLQHNLRKYGRAAGIETVHPHRFRHTFATQYLINSGNGLWYFEVDRSSAKDALDDLREHYESMRTC